MSPPVLSVVFLSLLATGIPIFLVLGGLSFLLYWMDGTPLISLAQLYGDRLNSITVVSIPLFVIAAQFMQKGGIAQALIDWAEAWVGRVPGGLAVVCVLATTVFAAISGSSTATAMAMGLIVIPAMLRSGYAPSFAAGTVGASGTLGILIPPSLVFILYAIVAEQSIPRLFLAGVVPGAIQACLFILYAIWHARRAGYAPSPRPDPAAFRRANFRALPALAIPLVVLGGIYSGMLTVSEAAGVAALLSMVASVAIYRQCRVAEVLPTIAEALALTAVLFFIMIGAISFSHWLISSGISTRIVEIFTGSGLTTWQFLLMVNLLLILLGTFLEVFGVLFIAVPVLLPIALGLGVDPIHFGVILVINMELAFITPPVGLNLFVLQSISTIRIAEIFRGILPYILILAALLLLVTYVPAVSLWLPNLVYGG
ncbi:Sialic acid TRAP transporter permease protein SiaT [Roseivivax jejudonensis]|uniref:TRAP transporter large permease protein n=1 Tax=Roseivivax jejudonensis TaxID=1529041 RepID=A0A1X7A5U0_9RHOB|nr:TRAP transporter large permease subunit [Roseivivax jejudonensis]SLN71077.1 Sialic acid TRAP transporter permease protein SiaT [Roseivivax jejudonensis]